MRPARPVRTVRPVRSVHSVRNPRFREAAVEKEFGGFDYHDELVRQLEEAIRRIDVAQKARQKQQLAHNIYSATLQLKKNEIFKRHQKTGDRLQAAADLLANLKDAAKYWPAYVNLCVSIKWVGTSSDDPLGMHQLRVVQTMPEDGWALWTDDVSEKRPNWNDDSGKRPKVLQFTKKHVWSKYAALFDTMYAHVGTRQQTDAGLLPVVPYKAFVEQLESDVVTEREVEEAEKQAWKKVDKKTEDYDNKYVGPGQKETRVLRDLRNAFDRVTAFTKLIPNISVVLERFGYTPEHVVAEIFRDSRSSNATQFGSGVFARNAKRSDIMDFYAYVLDTYEDWSTLTEDQILLGWRHVLAHKQYTGNTPVSWAPVVEPGISRKQKKERQRQVVRHGPAVKGFSFYNFELPSNTPKAELVRLSKDYEFQQAVAHASEGFSAPAEARTFVSAEAYAEMKKKWSTLPRALLRAVGVPPSLWLVLPSDATTRLSLYLKYRPSDPNVTGLMLNEPDLYGYLGMEVPSWDVDEEHIPATCLYLILKKMQSLGLIEHYRPWKLTIHMPDGQLMYVALALLLDQPVDMSFAAWQEFCDSKMPVAPQKALGMLLIDPGTAPRSLAWWKQWQGSSEGAKAQALLDKNRPSRDPGVQAKNKYLDQKAQVDDAWAVEQKPADYALGRKIAPVMGAALKFLQEKQAAGEKLVIHGRDAEILYALLARTTGLRNVTYVISSRALTTQASEHSPKYLAYLKRLIPPNAIHVDTGFAGSIPEWINNTRTALGGIPVKQVVMISAEDSSKQIPGLEALAPKYGLREMVLSDIEHSAQRLAQPVASSWGTLAYSHEVVGFWAKLYGICDFLKIPRHSMKKKSKLLTGQVRAEPRQITMVTDYSTLLPSEKIAAWIADHPLYEAAKKTSAKANPRFEDQLSEYTRGLQ